MPSDLAAWLTRVSADDPAARCELPETASSSRKQSARATRLLDNDCLICKPPAQVQLAQRLKEHRRGDALAATMPRLCGKLALVTVRVRVRHRCISATPGQRTKPHRLMTK